jgi:CRP-like cAMP-binding protein
MKLDSCPLFHGLSNDEIENLFEDKYKILNFKTGDYVGYQNDCYTHLFILLEGKISAEMIDRLGRTVVVEEIEAPMPLAPSFLFATQNFLPVDIRALSKVKVLKISAAHFKKMIRENEKVLNNYLRFISDKSVFISEKLKHFRFGTIKNKLALYLLEQYEILNNLTFTIPHTQQEMSDMFGVTRPALALALSHLIQSGAITSSKKQFQIVNLKLLKKFTI